MRRAIHKELERLKKIREGIIKYMESVPEKPLKCSKNKGCFQYYINGRYVPKSNITEAEKIAQRGYYKKLLPQLNVVIGALERVGDVYNRELLESCYDDLRPGRKNLVNPLFLRAETAVRKFMEADYAPLGFREENTTEYFTVNGERVRSKSEKLIADELQRNGIFYHYEMPLHLENNGEQILLRPDFTVLNKYTRKIYILEHFGMMDNEKYVQKALEKIELYEKNGYLLGDKLIILKETSTSPLNTRIMTAYIKKYFL